MGQSNHPEHRFSRRDFLKVTGAASASLLIDPLAKTFEPFYDFEKLTSRAEAAGENPIERLPVNYDSPPDWSYEVMKGVFYKKPLREKGFTDSDFKIIKNQMIAATWEMVDALPYVLNNSGTPGSQQEVKDLLFGDPKGSFFLNGPDNKFYEFAAGERGVYHLTVDDSGTKRLQRVLILRDLAFGRIQLDEQGKKYFELPKEAKDVLENRVMFGDPGSNSPTFDKMKKYLRVIGTKNCYWEEATNPRTNIAYKTLDKDLREGTIPDGVPWMTISSNINGQNVPNGTENFLNRRYGRDWVGVGLPISDPYWMWLNIGGNYLWVMCQAFERGTITFNPQNEERWKFEGGLAGNLFTAALCNGNEIPNLRPQNPDFLLPFTKEVDSTVYNRNGKDYRVESRVSEFVDYKVTMVPELKQELGRLISQDGEKHGFTSAELVLLGSEDEVPEGITTRWVDVGDPVNNRFYRIGDFTSHKFNDKVLLYYVPSLNIPFDNEVVMRRINGALINCLLKVALTGGEAFPPPGENPLEGKTEYINLINQYPLRIAVK